MSDNYEAVSRTLSNIRSLRVFAREMNNFDLLCEIQEKFSMVVEEMRADAERQQKEQLERDERKAELLKMISEAGFSVDELAGSAGAEKGARKTRTVQQVPAKYQYELDGETKFWTGRGRKPKPIEDAIKAGKSLDDFLIHEKSA